MDVYTPAEDTWLLASAVKRIKNKEVLEVGCGSGIVSIMLAKHENSVCAVDVNEQAVYATRKLAELEGVQLKCYVSDLFENVKSQFDYILFNFPYIPERITEETVNWAAGEKLELIERFVHEAPKHLKRGGKILFVISSLTEPKRVRAIFKKVGMKVKTLKSHKLPWEKLYLMEARLL